VGAGGVDSVRVPEYVTLNIYQGKIGGSIVH
jgi:hypothetical protein